MLSLQERQQKILEMLSNAGEVRVGELSRLFEVSEVCIRNDLSELEAKGMLSRVHGGAVSSYEPYYNMSLAQRSNTNKEEKDAIAQKIAETIHDNQAVMMNAGTSTLAVMRRLVGKKNITIITNSIVLALEGAKYKCFKIILLGGDVDPEYQYVYGTLTMSQLDRFYADKFILSADGIDVRGGVSTYYNQEADICRKMMSHCKMTVAALDHTKIGRVALCNIAPVNEVDCVVTTEKASKNLLSELNGCGVKILVSGEKA